MNFCVRLGDGEAMAAPGYYSTDEALYYVAGGGIVFLIGDIDTERDWPWETPRFGGRL